MEKKISKGLKEWNVIIEALGRGKQIILIRSYKTSIKSFVLYPTESYTKKEGYLDNFQIKHQTFVQKHAIPNKKEGEIPIKYHATIEKIVKISNPNFNLLEKFSIWNSKHIKSYLKNKEAFIWILRVYKLKKSKMIEPALGMRYSNLDYIDVSNSKPILNSTEFEKIITKIELELNL